MSKFIDRLKQVSQPTPAPMGFRRSTTESNRPRIQLVAHLENPPKSPGDRFAAADAVILSSAGTAFDMAWGMWLRKGEAAEAKQAVEAGADFVVLPAGGPVLAADKETGRVLTVETSIADMMLRAVNDLPIDAVLLEDTSAGQAGQVGAVTWRTLMHFRRFAASLTRPVLVSVPVTATAEELQLVWDTGVSGIVAHISSPADVVSLAELRTRVDGLQYPARRKEKLSPTVPQVAESHDEEPEEDEDDD